MSNKTAKNHLRQSKGWLQWIFLLSFIFFGTISIYTLRQNNLTMIRLREAVYNTDQSGGNVEAALKKLREHIYSHMNTNPSAGGNAIKPPIQLKYTYDRLVEAEKNRVAQINTKVYNDAQIFCESNNTAFSGRTRVPCIEDYVSKNGAKEKPIEDSLYKFDFISPSWSPDLAGITFVISVLSLIGFLILFGVDRMVRSELQKHQ